MGCCVCVVISKCDKLQLSSGGCQLVLLSVASSKFLLLLNSSGCSMNRMWDLSSEQWLPAKMTIHTHTHACTLSDILIPLVTYMLTCLTTPRTPHCHHYTCTHTYSRWEMGVTRDDIKKQTDLPLPEQEHVKEEKRRRVELREREMGFHGVRLPVLHWTNWSVKKTAFFWKLELIFLADTIEMTLQYLHSLMPR